MVNNLDEDVPNGNDKLRTTTTTDGSDDSSSNGNHIENHQYDINAVENPIKSYVRRRKCNENVQICEKKKKRESYRRISTILRKNESDRTADELKHLEANADIVRQINKRRKNLAETKERILEKEDPADVIELKAKKLADVLSRARHLICYTGAGISTSARIPDYRGSQGIWTLLQQGKEIGEHDLSLAEPTFTHMALYELHRRNILQYTLSQNCDGLHLRSGLPKKLLSEIHGNMYIEVCKQCKPNVEYWRLFDTTELTARYNHKTNRRCHFCFKPLIDTIVHFGERGRLKWPLNWETACKHAEKADVILCLGSSLKVLKKYTWLWQMDRPKNKRPKIYIVNLQWTPKDKNATLKINGKCDEIMKLVMDYMDIKVAPYDRKKDPIFAHASLLTAEERHTVSQPMLKHHIDEKNENQNQNDIETDETTDSLNAINIKNEATNSTINESKNVELESKDCSQNANNSNVPNLPHIDDANLESSSQTISSQTNAGCSTLIKSIKNEKIADESKQIGLTKAIIEQSMKNLSQSSSDEKRDDGYYKSLINYYRAIEGVLPHWYDANYAYSGLHSIINPPPRDVDIWSTIIIPIFQLNRNSAECEFCFDNYAEDKCQFYRPTNEFETNDLIRYRHGKRILCECCDYDDDDDDDDDNDGDDGNEKFADEEQNSLEDSEEPKTNSDEDDMDTNRVKRSKYEQTSSNGNNDIGQRIVQPGWYGKGYRKAIKRKKTRRSYQLS